MEIRPYRQSDTSELIELFRRTVHTVCRADYTSEQLRAWAPDDIDENKWRARLSRTFTLVVESGASIAGFANLEEDGGIDMFYVSADHQSRGIGSLLMGAMEQEARGKNLRQIHSDVSITARNFFVAKGFRIKKEYTKQIGEISFSNAIMVKDL